MPDTFTISVPGAPTASRGQIASAAPATVTGVKGRWKVLDGSEQVVSEALAGVGDVMVELEASTAISDDASITVAARSTESAHTFKVKKALPQSDEWTSRVICTEG
jgi:hypothetical protein